MLTTEDNVKESDSVREALKRFREDCARLDRGEIDAETFKVSRLSLGLYSQRQKGRFMLRTKVAGGILKAESLAGLAAVAENYSDGNVHITTRQDIQLYFVTHQQSAEALEKLYEAGIISLGAGGNSLRNMNACDHGGVPHDEIYDVAELAKAVSNYFLGHEFSKGLPRKVKVAFCGAGPDCNASLVDDIVFIANPDRPEPGFRLHVAGGMGAAPRFAQLLEEFVPVEDIHRYTLAVLKVFNRRGTRVNRNRARMKFLLEKIGIEEFRSLYQHELEIMGDISPLDFDTSLLTAKHAGKTGALIIKTPTGDLSSAQLLALSNLLTEHPAVTLQNTKTGDFRLDAIPVGEIADLQSGIKKNLGLAAAAPGERANVISCNGAATCNEGITNSKALAKELEVLADETGYGGKYRISVSGCPNACGLHHAADIGLQGSAKRVNGILVPHYQIYLGGTVQGTPAFAHAIIRVPAKRVLESVSFLLDTFEKEGAEGETFRDTFLRLGDLWFEQALKPYTFLPGHDESRDFYLDWDATEEFSTEDVGPGECGGAAMEMIDGYFAQARHDLAAAKASDDSAVIIAGAKNVVSASARALLVTYGLDPETDGELYRDFNAKIIIRGFVPDRFAAAFSTPGESASMHEARERLALSEEFIDQCLAAYTRMNAKANVEDEGHEKVKKLERLDLSGVKCPFNYIKVKLLLEGKVAGTVIEVLLDDGSPIRNVPKSLENDGHEIVKQVMEGEQHLLTIKKG